jgi:hypothetical protein
MEQHPTSPLKQLQWNKSPAVTRQVHVPGDRAANPRHSVRCDRHALRHQHPAHREAGGGVAAVVKRRLAVAAAVAGPAGGGEALSHLGSPGYGGGKCS